MDTYTLSALTEYISKQIPIKGLSISSENTITINYYENTSETDKTEINNLIEKFKLENVKREKLKQIDSDFENTTKQGWDSGQGFSLGITAQDVSLLVGLFVLAKEAATMGLNPPPVIDMNGGIHALSMQELTQLMLQYGQARAQISANDAMRRKAVENATTIEELNNI